MQNKTKNNKQKSKIRIRATVTAEIEEKNNNMTTTNFHPSLRNAGMYGTAGTCATNKDLYLIGGRN